MLLCWIKKLIYKCKECKEEWKRPLNKLIESFPSIYQFCNGNLNKFVMLLRKGVYPYEYMDSWEKFDETTLPPKEAFYNNVNLEDISDQDYAHAQKVWGVFEIKNVGEYHDLYVQSDRLLLSDIFENFRNMIETMIHHIYNIQMLIIYMDMQGLKKYL